MAFISPDEVGTTSDFLIDGVFVEIVYFHYSSFNQTITFSNTNIRVSCAGCSPGMRSLSICPSSFFLSNHLPQWNAKRLLSEGASISTLSNIHPAKPPLLSCPILFKIQGKKATIKYFEVVTLRVLISVVHRITNILIQLKMGSCKDYQTVPFCLLLHCPKALSRCPLINHLFRKHILKGTLTKIAPLPYFFDFSDIASF